MNLLESIALQDAGRERERLVLKYRAMRESPFAFLRGTCPWFYRRALPLPAALAQAPLAWICGDLHLENVGSYLSRDGQARLDVNDFEEGLLAPASWDLLRLLASIEIALGGRKARHAADARRAAALTLDAYVDALADGKPGWIERATATGMVRTLLDAVAGRDPRAFLVERTDGSGSARRIRTDNDKALPASRADRAMAAEVAQALTRHAGWRPRGQLLDVARRISGTASLGTARWVLLLRGPGDDARPLLLDLKEALPSALAPFSSAERTPQPRWRDDAQRVTALQTLGQAMPPEILYAMRIAGRPCVLRQLHPSQDRLDVDALKAAARPVTRETSPARALADEALRTIGHITAWSHLRGAGRSGAASVESLMTWGRRPAWVSAMRQASARSAMAVREDYDIFVRAFHMAEQPSTSRPHGATIRTPRP